MKTTQHTEAIVHHNGGTDELWSIEAGKEFGENSSTDGVWLHSRSFLLEKDAVKYAKMILKIIKDQQRSRSK